MFSSAGKRCFTIESLVAKENPLTAEDPIRPTALSYSAPTTDAFMNSYQAPPGRPLYQSPELVFPDTVTHPSLGVAPHQHLQHQHFFGTQHRDHPLNFYPWVLRNRFFGHRFQGEAAVTLIREAAGDHERTDKVVILSIKYLLKTQILPKRSYFLEWFDAVMCQDDICYYLFMPE